MTTYNDIQNYYQDLMIHRLCFISGIKYLGANLTLDIGSESTVMSVSTVDDRWPITMFNGKYNVTLVPETTGTQHPIL